MGEIRKDLTYNIIYQVLSMILPLITSPYISRTLGAEAVGIYSYTHSAAYCFLLFAMLGISNHGNRSVAATRDNPKVLNQVFTSIYILQCITFSIMLAVYMVYIGVYIKSNRDIAGIQMLYILSGMLDISWLFFGLEKFKITVSINTVIKCTTAALIFVFVHEPADLWKYTLIMSSGCLLGQAYMWMFRRRYVWFVRVTIKDVISNVQPVVNLFIPVLSYSIYKVMDKIMLGNMTTYEQTGYYNSAEKVINIPVGVITAFGTVMLPRMVNQIAQGADEKAEQYIRGSIKIVTVIVSAIAFGLIGISNTFAFVFFGAGYEPCAPIIQVLAGSVFFMAWASILRTQYLIPHQLDRTYVVSTMIGAVVNIIVNFSLIPKYQAIGAAIGTLMAECSVLVGQLLATRKSLPAGKYIVECTPVLVIGAIMSVSVYVMGMFLRKNLITVGMQIVCGGVLFISCMCLYENKRRQYLFFLHSNGKKNK